MSDEQETFIPHPHGPRGRPDYRCALCKDHGDVVASRKGDLATYAFKCTCTIGQRSRKNFPLWPGEGSGFEVVP